MIVLAADKETLLPVLLIFSCVGLEFVILVSLFGLAQWPVTGGDGFYYDRLATNILHHFAFSNDAVQPFEPSVFRTPGYPVFVAGIYLVSGGSFLALRIVQFVLLAATGVGVYRLALKFFDRTPAVIAGVLVATYPPLVFQAAYHLTETLSIFLAVLFIWLLARNWPDSSLKPRRAFAIGLVLGFGTLVRPSFGLLILIPLAVLLWRAFVRRSRERWALSISLLVLGYFLCIGPWAARNAYVAREFLPLGATSGMSLFYSMEQYANDLSYEVTTDEWAVVIKEYESRTEASGNKAAEMAPRQAGVSHTVATEILTDRSYWKDGLRKLGELTLWQIVSDVPIRAVYLWGPGDTSPWASGKGFHRVVQVNFLLLLAAILYGCYLARAELLRHWPLWAVPLYLTLVHLVFNVEPRYSFPGRPFLFVYAGVAIERLASVFLRRRATKVLSESAV